MSIKTGVGFSDGEDAHAVGVNACQSALNQLGEQEADFALVFSSVRYDQEKMLAGVRSVSKNARIVGCSSAGEIVASGPLKRQAVAVMLVKSDTMTFHEGLAENIAADARAAGKTIADTIRAASGGHSTSIALFVDVLAGNGADVVRGAHHVLGPHALVVGGAAADNFEFKKTFQYLNDRVYSGAVVGFGIGGDYKIGTGVGHGWMPVGSPVTVTKSNGVVVHEFDGKPAIALYEDYFGEIEVEALRAEKTLAKLAITYPLGLRIAGSDEMLIRDPLTVDQTGAITCTADIPEGSEVQLMVGSHDEAIGAAKDAAKVALSLLGGAEPKAAIIVDSIARSKLLGNRAADEIKAIQEVIGDTVPLIGFYSYGEVAPQNAGLGLEKSRSKFHNETVVITLIAE